MKTLETSSLELSNAVGKRRSRIWIYWCSWLAWVATVMLLRFTAFRGAGSDQLFKLASAYGLTTCVAMMLLNVIEGKKLVSYIQTHHPQKWQWLSYVPWFGSGMHNGFRLVPWLYSAEDLGDPILALLKKEHRRFIKWLVTVFLSYIVIVPVLLGL